MIRDAAITSLVVVGSWIAEQASGIVMAVYVSHCN